MSNYKEKYLKYKSRYMQLKGGFYCPPEAERGEDHNQNKDEETEICSICIERNVNIKFACCHCVCDNCYNQMRLWGPWPLKCPKCRSDIDVNIVWELREKKWIRQVLPPEPVMTDDRIYGLQPRDGDVLRLVRLYATLDPNEPLDPASIQHYITNAPSVTWYGRPPQQWIDGVRASRWNETHIIVPDPGP